MSFSYYVSMVFLFMGSADETSAGLARETANENTKNFDSNRVWFLKEITLPPCVEICL